MTSVVVGLDVGGTKTAIVVESLAGERLIETQVASDGWDAEPIESGVRWIVDVLAKAVPPDFEISAIGIGAQGLDSAEISREFAAALPWPSIAVNDAALLPPAAGFDDGIGLISGTGAIGVAQDADGTYLITGGWGWVIGDEAGAAGIVREATRAALRAHDDGATDDGLLFALLAAFGVDDAERLARAVNDDPTMQNWAPRSLSVFAAADAGSALARTVIDSAAEHLATLVDQLVRRGAVGSVVVAAGSVIVNQPRLFDRTVTLIGQRHAHLTVRLLTAPPVEGAIALARRALTTN